jgi:hypothetical protein
MNDGSNKKYSCRTRATLFAALATFIRKPSLWPALKRLRFKN